MSAQTLTLKERIAAYAAMLRKAKEKTFCTIRKNGRYYLLINDVIFIEQSLEAVIARMRRLRLLIDEHRRPGGIERCRRAGLYPMKKNEKKRR